MQVMPAGWWCCGIGLCSAGGFGLLGSMCGRIVGLRVVSWRWVLDVCATMGVL